MYVIAFGNKGRDGFGGRVRYQSCIFEVMHVTMKVSNSGIEVTSNDNVAFKLMLQTGSCLENLIEKVSFSSSITTGVRIFSVLGVHFVKGSESELKVNETPSRK